MAKLTAAELELQELRAEHEKLKAKLASRGTISLKVSEKGGLSVYGMGRFPVTLYKEQWIKLSEAMPQILDFIKDNEDTLKSKD